jgi:hypothetical protein
MPTSCLLLEKWWPLSTAKSFQRLWNYFPMKPNGHQCIPKTFKTPEPLPKSTYVT